MHVDSESTFPVIQVRQVVAVVIHVAHGEVQEGQVVPDR